MDLLEKFNAVPVKADAGITEADKQFCEQQQAAYTAALQGFQELIYFWGDMLAAQKAVLAKPDSPPRAYNQYLISGNDDGPKITIQRLRVHINTLHRKFIHALTSYFQKTYQISINESDLLSELLPARTDQKDISEKQAVKEYLLWASTVHLRYKDVVACIQEHCGGRSFPEQSIYELCRQCNEAVWCGPKHTARFEQKHAVISFLDCFCQYQQSHDRWEFRNNMKTVLLCAAHFETGGVGVCPVGFPQPPFAGTFTVNQLDFPGCEKLEQLRFFKNGRVDLRFSSDSFADQFLDTYLGRVYQG